MKTTIPTTKEVIITHVEIILPVRYGEEDIPNNFPLRSGDTWKARINIDTGQIEDWPSDPAFQRCSLEMKVCDEGTYRLLTFYGDHWDTVAEISEDYVPHGVVPGEYGDYVVLQIENGRVTNWPKSISVKAFFQREV